MVDVHVTTQSNFVFPGMMTMVSSHHDFLPPPPAPPPPPPGVTWTVEIPVPAMWPIGFGLQQNKLTTTVVHKFQFIMLEGHDCGAMIPHVSVPPINLQLPIVILFSSRKTLFSASKVRANSTAVGCSQLLSFPLPMLTCASPVSQPTSVPPMNALNNVVVGMTGGDILAGIVTIILTAAFEGLSYWACSVKKLPLFKNQLNPHAAKLLETLGVTNAKTAEVYAKALGGLAGKYLGASSVGAFAIKTASAVASGAAKYLITGDGSAKISVGSNYLGGSFTKARTLDGKSQYTGQVQVGSDMGESASASAQHSINPDGTTTNQTATTTASQEGQHQHKSKTDYDAEGKEKKTTDTDVDASGETVGPNAGNVNVHKSKTTSAPGKPTETSSSDLSGGGSSPGFWGENL